MTKFPFAFLNAALVLGPGLVSCKARHSSPTSGTLSRSNETVSMDADLSQFATCLKNSSNEGAVLCLPTDEYILQQNLQALAEDGKATIAADPQRATSATIPAQTSLKLDAGYAGGTLDTGALSPPDQNHEFESARIEKCYRTIHVFIGITVTWRAKDSRGEAVMKKYVTGANKSDDGTVYANGQASCSEIVTLTAAAKFNTYVRRVPKINDNANPAGVSVFTGVCAPLTGAPCHNAVYEHCVYLKGSGDLSNSVGVAPVLLKCLDSIFGN